MQNTGEAFLFDTKKREHRCRAAARAAAPDRLIARIAFPDIEHRAPAIGELRLEARHIRGIVVRQIDTGAGFERKAGLGRGIVANEGTEPQLHRLRRLKALRLHKCARPAARAKLSRGNVGYALNSSAHAPCLSSSCLE